MKMDTVRAEMVKAMKSGDKQRKDALSLLLAAIKNVYIDKRRDLTEDEENAVIQKEIKQLQEAVAMSPADKVDFIEKNKFTISVMSEFMPVQMDKDAITAEIVKVLAELGIEKPELKDKGRIMKELMPRVKGKADGKLVNEIMGSMF